MKCRSLHTPHSSYRWTLSVGSLHVVLGHGQVDGGVGRSDPHRLLPVHLVGHHVVTLEQGSHSGTGEDLPHLLHVRHLLPVGDLQVVQSRQSVLQLLTGVARRIPGVTELSVGIQQDFHSPERSVGVRADLIIQIE